MPLLDEGPELPDTLGIYGVVSGVSRLAQVQNNDRTIHALLERIYKKMIDVLNIKNCFK